MGQAREAQTRGTSPQNSTQIQKVLGPQSSARIPSASYLGTRPGPACESFVTSVPPSHPLPLGKADSRGGARNSIARNCFPLSHFVPPFLLPRPSSLSFLLCVFSPPSFPWADPPPSPPSLGFGAALVSPPLSAFPLPISARSPALSQSARGAPRPRPPVVPGGPGRAQAAGAERGAAGRGPMGPGGRAARARASRVRGCPEL